MIYHYENMTYDFVNNYFINYPITYKIWRTGHANVYSDHHQLNEQELKAIWYEVICRDNLILTKLTF